MGIVYNLISDEKRVGYELGKGPWHDLSACLRGDDPKRDIITLMKIQGSFEGEAYCAEVADEIVRFAKEHADWRVIDDSEDIAVMTDEDRGRWLRWNEPRDDIYRRVGSRYRT